MRRNLCGIILTAIVLAIAAGTALAGDTQYYNAKGQYVGKKDAAGRYGNAKGQIRARKDEQGRVYDDKGRYRGKEDRDTAPGNSAPASTPK